MAAEDWSVMMRDASVACASGGRRSNGAEAGRALEVWDEQPATVGGGLSAGRVALIDDLRRHLLDAYALLAGGADAVSASDVDVAYQTALGPDAVTVDRDAWREAIIAGMGAGGGGELGRGVRLVGARGDGLLLTLGGLPAKGYASHGESWSVALGLRLAGLEVLREDGDDPVLILDDVFAELDAQRRRRLRERVQASTPVLLTAACAAALRGGLPGPPPASARGGGGRGGGAGGGRPGRGGGGGETPGEARPGWAAGEGAGQSGARGRGDEGGRDRRRRLRTGPAAQQHQRCEEGPAAGAGQSR